MKKLITSWPIAFVPCLFAISVDMGVVDNEMLLDQDDEGLLDGAYRETRLARDRGEIEAAGE